MQSSHPKLASNTHPILQNIAQRFSPYVYDDRPVERGKLLSCLEAARWAPSSYNEQPWRFIVARREDSTAFATALSCLLEANQEWAKHAGVLILTLTSTHFSRNGKPNAVCEHDIGLAAATLTFQATELGLHVHQMAGIDADAVIKTYKVPDGFKPLTAIAIGYLGNPESADKELSQRDKEPRNRKRLEEWVFGGEFGQGAEFVK